ncbi:MAG: hypothetical protein C0436_04385 [Alphaproteobacteria bacterium]|nr:hypothetical protein [Alphaproteobacteria bacterium]
MKTILGKVQGSVVFEEDGELFGVVTENVTVMRGAHLRMEGIVMGDLVVHEGGSATVNGTVMGYILNDGGQVRVRGLADELGAAGVLGPKATSGQGRTSFWGRAL